MGSCFSKRKRKDATVTHNASPRSSFSLSCKSDVVTAPSPLRAHKPSEEIVVVVSKDSAPLLANTQTSHSLRKSQSAKVLGAQRTENGKTHVEGKAQILQCALQGTSIAGSDNLVNVQKTEKNRSDNHSYEAYVDKKVSVEHAQQEVVEKGLQCGYGAGASTNANERWPCTAIENDADTKRCTTPPRAIADANGGKIEDKEVLLSTGDEFVIEADDADTMPMAPSSLAKLKRSRSCEEPVRLPETKRPPGRRSFQEASTFSPRTPRLEPIPEPPQFGTTKFLEGLDLVDVLPHRLSLSDNQSGSLLGAEEELKTAVLDLSQHESHGLTADFFTLKNRYLSSCAQYAPPSNACLSQAEDGKVPAYNAGSDAENDVISTFDLAHSRASYLCSRSLSSQNLFSSNACLPQVDDVEGSAYNLGSDAEDDMLSSFGLIPSRTSSLDSAEHMDMVGLYSSSCRHPISVVEEEDENECGSDDSETFEFKHEVSIHGDALNQKKVSQRNRVAEEEGEKKGGEVKDLGLKRGGKGVSRVKELSVVATGDAVLYTGSNSEEFDLIPSRSYVRGASPKRGHCPSSDMVPTKQSTYYPCHKGFGGADDDDQEMQQQSSLSVDDIILMLEKDELDEDVLLSFLNLAKSTTPTPSHSGHTPSCHASDVASEASFEFKIKSTGSTPHSTPSTPMLSAGSTPKRITQLSPLALTSEEIAEIWGVFEQRQALSPFQMCNFS